MGGGVSGGTVQPLALCYEVLQQGEGAQLTCAAVTAVTDRRRRRWRFSTIGVLHDGVSPSSSDGDDGD